MGGLSNQILITAVFVFDVVLDGVAVEAFREGDEHLKMAEQHEAQLFVRRAAHRVMQAGLRQGDPLNQRVTVDVPLLLLLPVTVGDVIRLFTYFPNSHIGFSVA